MRHKNALINQSFSWSLAYFGVQMVQWSVECVFYVQEKCLDLDFTWLHFLTLCKMICVEVGFSCTVPYFHFIEVFNQENAK